MRGRKCDDGLVLTLNLSKSRGFFCMFVRHINLKQKLQTQQIKKEE